MWVFGGIDRATKDVFLVQVPDRSADTLIPIVQDKVLPGTTIVSDEWAAYSILEQYGFQHITVNHSEHFVDPHTGAHTQQIECLWSHAKAKLKRMRGTALDKVGSYLVEFMWRRKFASTGGEAFQNILSHAAELFGH